MRPKDPARSGPVRPVRPVPPRTTTPDVRTAAPHRAAVTAGPVDREALYEQFSRIAGPFEEPPADRPYTVQYRNLLTSERRRGRALLLTGAALVLELAFLSWLLSPGHLPVDDGTWAYGLSMTIVAFTALIELLRLVNVFTLGLATLRAADPVPVAPQAGTRVAFLTTIVPGKEPLSMVRTTLEAALRVRHDGVFDVWLLDEGNDADVKAMCAELGVSHFSRHGVGRWNQDSGRNKRRTKHGNYNAWLDHAGHHYDFWVSVDTDHVPRENFAERLLGYFRDPDVAFVVGPQVYGNDERFVARAAESQQYLFHSVLQRAANACDAAMLVGTNNAVRLSALRSIDGLQDSITEDAATSIRWHATQNPETGRKWKSVYTPDVLAVGEGPESWTDYFIQQHRWARGTNEVILSTYRHVVRGLTWTQRLHYGLLLSYYPSAALAWLLGSVNIWAYLLTGSGGFRVSLATWATLYVNAAVLQVAVFFWNRGRNVSPHEQAGSSGVSGMFVSVLSAPMYVSALWQGLRRRNVSFAVTPKGADASPDRLATFRKNLAWAAVTALCLLASFPLGHRHGDMQVWALLSLTVSVLPVLIWQVQRRRRPTVPALTAAPYPSDRPAPGAAPRPVVTAASTPRPGAALAARSSSSDRSLR